MVSSLTWLDHDAAAHDRSLRILALFKEKETRDELGIGGIRDAIADRLFPGTSTIQTRLRYMLLVPWMYQRLEEERVPAGSFAMRARQEEIAMVRPLLDAGEAGVFGSQAGSGLKRLPSSVYWAGLAAWGIRRFPGSQDEYHRTVDLIYERRRRPRYREDDDLEADPRSVTWHPRLPPPPAGFPGELSLTLMPGEASFLRDRIVTSAGDSLLAWLVLNARPDGSDEPWLHHQQADFPVSARGLLHHARLLADVIEAAARVYNLCLAEEQGSADRADMHRKALEEWRIRSDRAGVERWSLEDLWDQTLGFGHTITLPARRFVETWVQRLQLSRGSLADDEAARRLVRDREMSLKGPRSRFRNRGALAQWGGSSGTARLTYRWPTARRFLDDLLPALATS